ncbi:MAG TPA: CBS domain-containing protein [Thermoleophilaceae bacterium]|jgi:CBS domain-containing protein|nr:CBS domain-containing protein [Thermoleophilaceae bacterium]
MPTGTTDQPLAHTFAAPAFEHASVVDAMRIGIISCQPTASLKDVARIMATYRIHSVVVSEMEGGSPLGVISDVDLAAAAARGSHLSTAAELARAEPVTVAADDSLGRAAQLMAEHEVSHLVVIQPHSGHPVGMLSALDVAGVLAWGGTA